MFSDRRSTSVHRSVPGLVTLLIRYLRYSVERLLEVITTVYLSTLVHYRHNLYRPNNKRTNLNEDSKIAMISRAEVDARAVSVDNEDKFALERVIRACIACVRACYSVTVMS